MNDQGKITKKSEPLAVRKVNQKIKEYKMGAHAYNLENPHEKDVKQKRVQQYFIRTCFMFLAAFMFNFGAVVFLQRSETIPSGLSGVPMLISLIFHQTKPFFGLMYLACNIPLFFFLWKKTKLSFNLHTLEFMIFQTLINFVLTAGTKDNTVADWFHNVFNVAPGWERTVKIDGVQYENPVTWPILANGLIGSLFVGIAISLAWRSGGSTGGTDIIAYFFSTKKQKSVGGILTIVSLATSITFLIIFAFAQPHNESIVIIYKKIGDNHYVTYVSSGKRVIVGMREITSFAYIAAVNGLISVLYPKYKKVNVEISCVKSFDKVMQYFNDINYWHSYSIYTTTSGYSGEKVYKINTTMLLLETKNIIQDLRVIDPKIWISIKPILKIHGNFNTRFVDDN
ncbi:YitT family protein [Mycoplasma sp. ES3157-GEN-MYC]|uniref:YitT family protein n=1 Tax=Mycoplasma miroungigenitalium TaxID=754515 RepID=A0A6M4JBI6_9MOLU|nr:YitT family protein [Mycoplasma miroungigenitalium]MBU4690277.1 YitT family protein [Mycoplasma miroungigenitalium]MBU4691544.1 YitT family protein [Mycoplasma miroungigenitalium]QJR43376.1 YitT family protein [Mycoplasma miroungigenitalium]